MGIYKGPFQWQCVICERVHFMERDADRCCDRGKYPPTPIMWRPPADEAEQA
jgi:hypothetical protein